MDDLISRQAAIDTMMRLQTEDIEMYGCAIPEGFDGDRAAEALKALSSAQPERRDCGWTGIEDDYPVSIREVMDITAETGALTTQSRVMELKPYRLPESKTGRWIPCSERLPEEAYPVVVTWKNDDPASYYQYILGKHYTGVAHFKNGKWFWYSSVTEDVLMEYGRCDSEEFDEAIQVLAWMPLPEPYKED